MHAVIRGRLALAAGLGLSLMMTGAVAAQDQLPDAAGDVVYSGTDIVAANVSINADRTISLDIEFASEPAVDPVLGEVTIYVGLESRNEAPTANPGECGSRGYRGPAGGGFPSEAFVVLHPEQLPPQDPGVFAAVSGRRSTVVLGPEFIGDAKWVGVHLEAWVFNEMPDWVPDWPGQESFYGGCHFFEVPPRPAPPPTETAPPPRAELSTPIATLLIAMMAIVGAAVGLRLRPSGRRS